MSSDVFVKLMGAILTILATLITVYVIPAIKAHMTEKDMAVILSYIEIAVRCADQLFTVEEFEEKKAYVFNYIKSVASNKLHINLSDQDIDTLIEGFVNEIHNNGVK